MAIKDSKDKSKKTIKKKKPAKEKRVVYNKRPEDMQLDLWQYNLRKQFGSENTFNIHNTGNGPFYSSFKVWNPATNNSYEVHLNAALPRQGLPAENTLTSIGNTCTCQDFKTNRLGLCKHISAVFHFLSKKRGVKKAFSMPFRPAHAFLYVDYRHEPRIRLYIGSVQQAVFENWSIKWFDAAGFLTDLGFTDFETVLEEARGIQPEFHCFPDTYDLIVQERDRLTRLAMLNRVLPKGAEDTYLDHLLKATLFPFQKTGIYFAAKAGRCIIGDEMGLGKTIQAIGAAELMRREMGIQKVLVVCPTSLKYQWKTEIQKFADASVEVVEGSRQKRLKHYQEGNAFFNVISYNSLANDAEQIHLMDADLLIIDEAQRIKNFRTKVSAQLKKVRTPYCFVLTGTPIENKLEELYAITQFVDQYKLPPLYRFLDRYQVLGDNGQVVGYQNLKEIGQQLQDCLIRRLKKDVLKQLPKRLDKVLYVPMTQEQKDIHRELGDAVARLVSKWHRLHFLSEKDRRILMLCLSQMRMVADSTFILDQQTRFDTKINELNCIFEEALADPDQKIVVFSQWERMTRLVAQELDEYEIGYANLHGGIPSADRADLLDRFREDPSCRVFLSTDAGGVGLNLQSASMLINLDLPWNPAVLEQRIGRIYRMGQNENVTIINLVSQQSIEERMLGILAFKASVAQGVLDPDGDDTIFMSESKFKKFMENVESLYADGWKPLEEGEAMEDDEGENYESAPTVKEVEEHPMEASFVGDDDVNSEAGVQAEQAVLRQRSDTTPQQHREASEKGAQGQGKGSFATAPQSAQELIHTGLSFFTGLAQTLSSPEKTQELVNSIVEKDEKTGQSYLKIPVENAAVVEQAVQLFAGLLSGMGKRG